MIEFIAVIFSLSCVILTTQRNILCWPVGLIGIIAYSIIFYKGKDWSNFLLQFVFTIQSIIGWINWKKSENLKIKSLKAYDLFTILVASVLLFICFDFTNSIFNGNLTELDAATATLSLFGMFLLGKSKIEAWFFWILADIIYIYFFFIQGLYLSSVLYFIFLILAIYGYFNWKKLKN
jgi:nicotinamide mononucleotide transporter